MPSAVTATVAPNHVPNLVKALKDVSARLRANGTE